MGSSSGSLRPVRRLPEGPRLRAGWSSWEAGRESFCRGTGCALLPCPPDEGEDTVATNQPAKRSLAAGLLALLRPPNVFTAIADPFAGLVLARPPGPVSGDPGRWCIAASACLYLGGIALNDYFDREVDAVERPERPIPSGAVPPAVAAGLGAALLAAGIALAGLAGGAATTVAAALALAIVLYDAVSKGTEAGFLNMGICRGLNFYMPMSLAMKSVPTLFFSAPVLLTAYISVLTYLAREEVGGNTLERARRGVTAMAVVALVVAVAIAPWPAAPAGWAFLALVVALGAMLFAPLWTAPGGPTTGRAIGGGMLMSPLVDASFVAAAGQAPWAFAVASLMLPAMALRRMYSPT